MFYCHNYESPIGMLTLAANENSIVGLWLHGQRFYMDILRGQEYREEKTEVIELAEKWLGSYFKGEKPEISELPIEFVGSDFRVQVWEMLTEIPYGKAITYGDLAKEISKKKGIKTMSAQAVGGAVGRNPISIIVPCHRVVGAKGNLTGYSGGLETKIKLLEHEGFDISELFVPTKGKAL